jgi:ribonuclease P protein component
MGSFSFSKIERILNRRDFVNLNRVGQPLHTEHFAVIINQNDLDITRLGVTVSKRTGNVVKRNRVKRLIREFFRLHKSRFPQGYDIVILSKKGACNLDFWTIEEELGKTLLNHETLGVHL